MPLSSENSVYSTTTRLRMKSFAAILALPLLVVADHVCAGHKYAVTYMNPPSDRELANNFCKFLPLRPLNSALPPIADYNF